MPRRTKAQSKPRTKPKPSPSLTLTRQWSDLYCLWRFCGTRACRRGRACSGNVRGCFVGLPLVPPEALAFMLGFEDGQNEGLSFDDMMARNEDEWEALEDWQHRVMSSLPESDVWSED